MAGKGASNARNSSKLPLNITEMLTDFTVTCTANTPATTLQAPKPATPTESVQPGTGIDADSQEPVPKPAAPLLAPKSLSPAERTIMGLVQGETIF